MVSHRRKVERLGKLDPLTPGAFNSLAPGDLVGLIKRDTVAKNIGVERKVGVAVQITKIGVVKRIGRRKRTRLGRGLHKRIFSLCQGIFLHLCQGFIGIHRCRQKGLHIPIATPGNHQCQNANAVNPTHAPPLFAFGQVPARLGQQTPP